MANYVAKTMFEVTVSNSVRNQIQNVAGKFGTSTGTTFAAADCSAGLLVIKNGLIKSEGYEELEIYNGNTWYFNVATAGTSGSNKTGDHTGIYACNSYDVNKVTDGDLEYNISAKTLGNGVPAGERGTFTEIIVGEQYTFGKGNFSTAPSTGIKTGYATIQNGFLVFSASKPSSGSGVYFTILRVKNVTEGAGNWGEGYVCEACRIA